MLHCLIRQKLLEIQIRKKQKLNSINKIYSHGKTGKEMKYKFNFLVARVCLCDYKYLCICVQTKISKFVRDFYLTTVGCPKYMEPAQTTPGARGGGQYGPCQVRPFLSPSNIPPPFI